MNNIEHLNPNEVYHIFNKAVAKNLLFRNHHDYMKFMDKMSIHLYDIVDFYAYCLLPNHFHFLVRVKTIEEIEKLNPLYINEYGISNYLSKRFSNFFNSYSKTFNIKYERKGTLFLRPFKRIAIDSDHYFTQVVSYIHRNPIHHQFVKSLNAWDYSSYKLLVSNQDSFILKEEVLEWFGGLNKFIHFHQEMKEDWEATCKLGLEST